MAPSKLTPLKGLYAITDAALLPDTKTLTSSVEQALEGGIQLLQYRNKQASLEKQKKEIKVLKALCDHYHCPLIINDQLALAKAFNCGVHLGQQDRSLKHAREALGPDALIGITCHNSLALAATAIERHASYVAFGRLYPSITKPDAPAAELQTITHCKQRWPSTPVIGIGGITADNASQVISAGADMVAVINAIWNTNDITSACRALQQRIIPSA